MLNLACSRIFQDEFIARAYDHRLRRGCGRPVIEVKIFQEAKDV